MLCCVVFHPMTGGFQRSRNHGPTDNLDIIILIDHIIWITSHMQLYLICAFVVEKEVFVLFDMTNNWFVYGYEPMLKLQKNAYYHNLHLSGTCWGYWNRHTQKINMACKQFITYLKYNIITKWKDIIKCSNLASPANFVQYCRCVISYEIMQVDKNPGPCLIRSIMIICSVFLMIKSMTTSHAQLHTSARSVYVAHNIT
jgi:hypothetical protein